ncbi:GNAT family N-acetyltransferase [Roseateles sp.]|uniref:GNAT family N-acetyltransferase n=1 Tax=Roseateles sp. TaxID=1971397 RepID=UPI0039E7F2F4
MQFTALPESGHPLVRLRPITAADVPVWFDYLSLPAVQEHTSWSPQASNELDSYAAEHTPRTPSSPLRLAIAERAGGHMVGSIGFHTVSPEHRTAELAYDLSPAVWGQGIASHLTRTLVEWAHGHVGLLRVQATALASNLRSMNVLERCGFEREGLLRSYRLVRGQPGDFWMFAHVVAPGTGLRRRVVSP